METELISLCSTDADLETRLTPAAEVIKRGGLVVFPTETVYGLGADATNKEASIKIYEAKGRPSDNPLIIHIADPKEAERYAYTSEAYYRLAENFMPGPITVVMPVKDTIPRTTTGGLDTVAVRCPLSPIARALIRLSGVPIAAPSANRSGSPSATSLSHVVDDMYGRCDIIIDGGESEIGLESTIVKIDGNDSLTLLRPGEITPEQLREAGFRVSVSSAVLSALKEGEKPLSPGMMYKHYAPKSPLFLLDGDIEGQLKYVKNENNSSSLLITYSEYVREAREELVGVEVYDFGSIYDKKGQAKRLFALLREADKHSFLNIYAPLPDRCGIGLALYNRMIRAAAYKIIKV